MDKMKYYEVFGYIKLNNKKYCVLYSQDWDRFFMEEKNGELDYITIEEYMQLLKCFPDRNILFSDKEYFKVIYSNKKPKNEKLRKRIFTSKLVWRGTTLISLTLALALIFGKPIQNAVASNMFDSNLTIEDFDNNGVESSDGFMFTYYNPEITNYDNYKISLITEVNKDLFPDNSNIISNDNFKNNYHLVNKDEFCELLGLTPVTYQDIYNTIDNSSADKDIKELLTKGIKLMEEKKPNEDLRLLNYNLKNCKYKQINEIIDGVLESNSQSLFAFNVSEQIFYITINNSNENLLLEDIIHELLHLLYCAFDKNTGARCTGFVDVIQESYKHDIEIIHNVGKSLDEYKADKNANLINNRQTTLVDYNAHTFGLFYYSIIEKLYDIDNIEQLNVYELMNIVDDKRKLPDSCLAFIKSLDVLHDLESSNLTYVPGITYDYYWNVLENNILEKVYSEYENGTNIETTSEIINDLFNYLENTYNIHEESFEFFYNQLKDEVLDEIKRIYRGENTNYYSNYKNYKNSNSLALNKKGITM